MRPVALIRLSIYVHVYRFTMYFTLEAKTVPNPISSRPCIVFIFKLTSITLLSEPLQSIIYLIKKVS